MEGYKNRIQKEFEENLGQLKLPFWQDSEGSYTVQPSGNTNLIEIILIEAESNTKKTLLSPNGNNLLSSAYFKIGSIKKITHSEFVVMGFINEVTEQTEFIIISTPDFFNRIIKNHVGMIMQDRMVLRFWLMDDRGLYETTELSLEAEWFFLSKGINGRMADGTEWNFTIFLNNWQPLNKC